MKKIPNTSFFVIFLFLWSFSFAYAANTNNDSFAIFGYHVHTKLEPYDWRYIRVAFPSYYSSATIVINTDINHDYGSIKNHKKQPIICFKDGGPPLPDVSEAALQNLVLNKIINGSVANLQFSQNPEQCYPLQKRIMVKIPYEQILPGIYYIGLFNGIGPVRTQSKMINRGSTYSFSANFSIEYCHYKRTRGRHCNRIFEVLPQMPSQLKGSKYVCGQNDRNNQLSEAMNCKKYVKSLCPQIMEFNFYSLVLEESVEQLVITAKDFGFSQPLLTNDTLHGSDYSVMCHARLSAIPDNGLYDFSGDISKSPLVINFPKAGTWYFSIQILNRYQTKLLKGINQENTVPCFSVEWKTFTCPPRKAGSKCTWERHALQAHYRQNPTVPLVYTPVDGDVSPEADSFHLDPFLTQAQNGSNLDYSWTYFTMNATTGVSGKNIHIQLISDKTMNYELCVRYGGLPSSDTWDYRYSNGTSSSNSIYMFKLYDTNQEKVNLYILYPREGLWNIGLRKFGSEDSHSEQKTLMSVSIKSCPNRCSDHGRWFSMEDLSERTYYSYCLCDRYHGGFDCASVIVSPAAEKILQISLIASNAAAIFPAFKSLRHKAGAEFVIFMSSGISSALYHACDVGLWCSLSFRALQFLDFWLSFVAVVSTFLYLTSLSEAAKRTIQAMTTIITALMAITGATRSSNIAIVLSLGAVVFLVGWLIEFFTRSKNSVITSGSSLSIGERWRNFKKQCLDLIKAFRQYFNWWFLLLGFAAFSLAATGRMLENPENYWIWHSIWHISIYISAFFFLCSKQLPNKVRNKQQQIQNQMN